MWHSLLASTYPPTHVFLSFLRPGGSISKARGGVGTDCNIVRLAPARTTTTTSPPPPRCRKRAQIHSITKRDKRAQTHFTVMRDKRAQIHTLPNFQQLSRSMSNLPHSIHQNCLCTITSSYRHLASKYTLLLNASITYTICRPKIPLHIYLSVVRQ